MDPVVPARTLGDVGLDVYCEEILAAGRAYERGEISREEYDRTRKHYGTMIAAAMGWPQPPAPPAPT